MLTIDVRVDCSFNTLEGGNSARACLGNVLTAHVVRHELVHACIVTSGTHRHSRRRCCRRGRWRAVRHSLRVKGTTASHRRGIDEGWHIAGGPRPTHAGAVHFAIRDSGTGRAATLSACRKTGRRSTDPMACNQSLLMVAFPSPSSEIQMFTNVKISPRFVQSKCSKYNFRNRSITNL